MPFNNRATGGRSGQFAASGSSAHFYCPPAPDWVGNSAGDPAVRNPSPESRTPSVDVLPVLTTFTNRTFQPGFRSTSNESSDPDPVLVRLNAERSFIHTRSGLSLSAVTV